MTTKLITCATCDDEMDLVNTEEWGQGMTSQCMYSPLYCEYCCNCGGH